MSDSSAPKELPPLETRVIQVDGESRARSITKIALIYLGYFLLAAAVIGALVLTHQALLPILCVGAFFALVPTVSLGCRAIAYLTTRSVRKDVVEAQVKHLMEAFDCELKSGKFVRAGAGDRTNKMTLETVKDELKEVEGITEIQATYFAKKVMQLKNEVLELKDRDVSLDSVQTVYSKFQALAEESLFKQIYKSVQNQDLECVNFLKILAMKFRTAFVGKIMGSYAKETLPEAKAYTPEEIGNIVNRHKDSWFGFKRDKPHQMIPWLLAYPDRCVRSTVSNDAPGYYDSMEGNNAVCFMESNCNGVPVFLVAQPTLATDPVFDLIGADAADQVIVNLLDTCKSYELPWIRQLDERAKKSEKVDHLVFGFTSKKRSGLMSHEGSKLLDAYRKRVQEERGGLNVAKGTGTIVSSSDLSNEEIDEIFDQVKSLVPDDVEMSKRKKQAALALADAMMVFKKIVKKTGQMPTRGENMDSTMHGLTVSVGCKQCQDRGPIILMALMLLMKAHENGGQALTEKDFYQIASVVLRAPVNEGRLQLGEKAEVLKELFGFFGKDIGIIHQITKQDDTTDEDRRLSRACTPFRACKPAS